MSKGEMVIFVELWVLFGGVWPQAPAETIAPRPTPAQPAAPHAENLTMPAARSLTQD